MIKISVTMQNAICSKDPFEHLTTGLVGQKVFFDFSDDWSGYKKTAVFEGGGVSKDEILTSNSCTIPPECLAEPGSVLQCSVYGVKGDLVTPTIYCDIGEIERGADPSGDESTDPSLPVWAQLWQLIGDIDDLNTEDKSSLVAAINEAISKGASPEAIIAIVVKYLEENPVTVKETDPTVPAWAKAESKPSYTKSEVGLGNVDNVKQYSASNPPPYPVTSVNGQTGAVKLDASDVGARPSDWMPSASDVGARPDNWMPTAQEVGALPNTYTPPNQTAAQVGADPAGTAESKVSAHNTKNDAHNDIRLLITGLTSRLDALANSDDDTLDQMAEVVAYIKANRDLIQQITTGKVSVTDIINNLTTNVTNKPLSAAQGVALKALIDAITVPTKLSQLAGDSTHRTVTDAEKTSWNAVGDKLNASELPTAINTALAQAKASGEFDGDPGTSVTVKSVSESTEDGGSNVVTFSDGKKVTIKNGKQGSPGKTPVKGTDYGTPADQEAIVQQVISALGTPVFGTVDADNNIILTGDLADGGYIVKYEDGTGGVTTIGNLTLGVTYTNALAEATDESGNVLNGVGYKVGYRVSSYSGDMDQDQGDTPGFFATGFMPYSVVQSRQKVPIYIKGVSLDLTALPNYLRFTHCIPGSTEWVGICQLNKEEAINNFTVTQLGDNYFKFTPNANLNTLNGWYSKNMTHMRWSLPGNGEGVIITINEPIE